MKEEVKLRKYHAPVWSEPIIMEMGHEGERGISITEAEEEVKAVVGDAQSYIPLEMRRKELPKLPELAQPQVLRHFLHLTQQTLGMEETIDIGSGTCTMKYSPKVNEILAATPQMTEIHPFQDEDTIQGILEVIYKFDLICREISGMDQFTFQPGGGSQAAYANACVMRAYHDARGELARRNEVITTILSHPCDTATPVTAGFKVISLMPDKDGYPDLEALKTACSEHTAGLMITNPEDTGIYNPRIEEYVDAVHEVGGLCFYDQANLNGILGISRARDAGFDACHFNLHKTFSTPHGSYGPASGAYGVVKELAEFLPTPIVTFDGKKYHLDYDRPSSFGRVREFFGNAEVVLKAYAWTMSMGAEGLLEAAHVSVINNNYLDKLLMAIPGISKPYAEGKIRLDQVRYSWEKLKEDTGCGTEDLRRRLVDFGIQNYHSSHHPWIIPEPMTPEPCETYSKEDCDYWAAALKQMSKEAYTNPEIVKMAPHNSSIHKVNAVPLDDPKKWAMTWRAYLKKRNK
ncbi:putative glycine dehydrogenase (decarboxylating) subunit 2 [subsurface metagenome]